MSSPVRMNGVPELADNSSTLDVALALAKVGWHVFPVDHPDLPRCAGIGQGHDPQTCTFRGKHPAVAFSHASTTNPKMITTWWTGPSRNVGIHCGPSGLVVIDEDRPGEFKRYADEHEVRIPPTFVVSTAKGRHFYFAAPAGQTLGNQEGGFRGYSINVRGENGYVVGPGSLHSTGVVYAVEYALSPAPLPSWVVAAVRRQTSPDTSLSGAVPVGLSRGLDAVPEVIRGPRNDSGGERHDALMRYACSLRARSVSRTEAEPLFRAVWQRCEQPPACTSPLTWIDALAKLDDVYQRYPEGKSAEYRQDEANGADQPAPGDESLLFDRLVREEVRKIKVRESARALVDAESRPEAEPFDAGSLAEILARPAEPMARIEQLLPWESSLLLSAQRKVGKTSFLLNMARSLLTGEEFLGRFGIRPLNGSVAVLNFEVSGGQLGRWAADIGVPPDRLFLVNLRGRRNPLTDTDDRDRLARWLRAREVEALFCDPFGRAYTGKSQNDAGEVQTFLISLDQFARSEVGARDLILTAHAGWNGERTRGSSALEDWADSLVTLTRDDAEDSNGERYLRAIGRDVDLEEDQLTFDPETRTLTLAGSGSRKTARVERRHDDLDQAALNIITTQPGINGAGLGRALREASIGLQKGDEYAAAKRLVGTGKAVVQEGPRNSKLYFPANHPDLPRATPAGQVLTYPDPPYKEGVGQEGYSQAELPRVDTDTDTDTTSPDISGTDLFGTNGQWKPRGFETAVRCESSTSCGNTVIGGGWCSDCVAAARAYTARLDGEPAA